MVTARNERLESRCPVLYATAMSFLLAIALATGTPVPPPVMPDAIRQDNLEERRKSYNACLYYASLAWIKNHAEEKTSREIAQIAIYKCDLSLQKYALALSVGTQNPKQSMLVEIARLRADVPYAQVFVIEAMYDPTLALRPNGDDTTATPHPR